MRAAHAPKSALRPGTAAEPRGMPHAGGLPARATRAWVLLASWPSDRTGQTGGIPRRRLHAPQTGAEPNGFLRHPSGQCGQCGQHGHVGKPIRIPRHGLPDVPVPGSGPAARRWPRAATCWPTMYAAPEKVVSALAHVLALLHADRGGDAVVQQHCTRQRHTLRRATRERGRPTFLSADRSCPATTIWPAGDHCADPVVPVAQSTHTPRTAISMLRPV